MPRKLSEIKEFSSKKSLEKINEDPAKNSVMGNVKKLYDTMAEYDDFMSKKLRENLGTILDAHQGKTDVKTGDTAINMLHGAIHGVYLLKVTASIR